MKSQRVPCLRRPLSRTLCALALGALLATLSPATWAAPGTVAITDVTLQESGEAGTVLTLATSGKADYSARVAEGGRRLIVDLANAEVRGAPAALTKGRGVVSGVLTQTFESDGHKTTRLFVQLTQSASYRLVTIEEGLRIELAPADKTGPATGGPVKTPTAAVVRSTGTASIADVRFEHKPDHDRIIVSLEGAVEPTQSTPSSSITRLELRGAHLPAALQRKLDVSAFGGAVRSIATYEKSGDGSRVILEIERDRDASVALLREGDDLVIAVARGGLPTTATGLAADGGAARRTRTVARETALEAPQEAQTSFAAAASATESTSEPDRADGVLPTVLGEKKRFSGRRIDLDMKDADIHNVLRLLSDVGRVNIVTSDSVSGQVTIRVRNVPWDQALETVLQAKGLGMVRQGNMIRVAPIADLNKERELDLARRKSELQLAPLETRLVPVSYATASELQARAKDLLSPRGTIAVDERTSTLIVRDVVGNLNQIEELVNALDTQTPQVLIEARVVEATSRYLRDVGIQWGGDATMSQATGNPTGLAFPSNVGIVGGASDQGTPTAGLSPFATNVANPNFAVNLPAIVGTGQGGALGLTLGSVNNTVNLAVRLSAAESSGMLRIISSPRVLTLDNRKARISQGTLIPFSQISAQGVQTTFQEAKLQLLVTPHVTAEGSVAMHVKINRDEPDFNQTSARGDPTILKREAETDLLVLDGHTAVIGGIFTRNTGRNLDQVPLLGDIPILGVLFQRRRASDSRSELVIFLTPRIVNRAEALGR
jgi:type IV pilus assembly protein PilQ